MSSISPSLRTMLQILLISQVMISSSFQIKVCSGYKNTTAGGASSCERWKSAGQHGLICLTPEGGYHTWLRLAGMPGAVSALFAPQMDLIRAHLISWNSPDAAGLLSGLSRVYSSFLFMSTQIFINFL